MLWILATLIVLSYVRDWLLVVQVDVSIPLRFGVMDLLLDLSNPLRWICFFKTFSLTRSLKDAIFFRLLAFHLLGLVPWLSIVFRLLALDRTVKWLLENRSNVSLVSLVIIFGNLLGLVPINLFGDYMDICLFESICVCSRARSSTAKFA